MQLTSTLTNHLVNNLQFGWNHIYATFYLGKATTNVLDAPGGVDSFGNGWDYGLDPFSSFASSLGGSNGQARKTGTISYTESLSWVHGNHTMKFGFDFRDVGENGFDNFSSRRQLTLDPEAAFGGFDPGIVANEPANDLGRALVDGANAYWGFVIDDVQNQFFSKAATRLPTDNKFFKQHELDWYGQDSWKIRPNFTLNIGLRYQYNGVPYETSGNFSNLLQDPGTFATGQAVTFSLVGPESSRALGLAGIRGKMARPRSGPVLVSSMTALSEMPSGMPVPIHPSKRNLPALISRPLTMPLARERFHRRFPPKRLRHRFPMVQPRRGS